MAAAQAYDSAYILMYALFAMRNSALNGQTLRASMENMDQIYYGVVATYEKPFSLDNKEAISRNMLVMRMVKNSAVTFAYPDDAKRNLLVQRKQ